MRIGSRHLPLSALEGFEAAGRHLNMRLAGEELHVTQSAISHQVRALERALDTRLFAPNRRRLVLTEDGRRLLATVRAALDQIAAAALRTGDETFAASLSVAAPPAFASLWLVPRLPRFLELFPDLSLHLTRLPADAETLPRVDAAITFNRVQFPGLRVQTLVRLEMFPVCTPALAATLGASPQPAALRGATLIHEDDGAVWARWFAAMGVAQNDMRRHVHVPSTQHALALARAGVGLAIDDGFMGGQTIADGTLVRPFGARSFPFGQYALVTPPDDRISPVTSAFADWLLREVAMTAPRR